MIQISIFTRYTEAEAGFQFCVSKAEEGVKMFEEQGEEDRDQGMNLYAMLGVSLDAYGKFMLKRKKFAIAEEAYNRAIKICENQLAENGKPHPQVGGWSIIWEDATRSLMP